MLFSHFVQVVVALRSVRAAADRVHRRRSHHLPPALAHHQRQLFLAELAYCRARFSAFDDRVFAVHPDIMSPPLLPRPAFIRLCAVYGRGGHVVLSMQPVLNLFTESGDELQLQPLHLVNTYGAFGSVAGSGTKL